MADLWSRKKAADYLKLSPLTLRKWAWLKINLPFIRVGHFAKYRKEDLDAYIQKQTFRPR